MATPDGSYKEPEGEFFYRVMVQADSQEEADNLMLEMVAGEEVEFAHEGDWDAWGQAPPDTEAIDELVNFVRTPEWSVSMMEDIAVIVRQARPHDDFSEFLLGDVREWKRH